MRLVAGALVSLVVFRVALAAAPTLVEHKHDGVTFSAPDGWTVTSSMSQARAARADGLALISIAAIRAEEGTLEEVLGKAVPSGKQKTQKGWRCAETTTEGDEWRIGTCGAAIDGGWLLVGLSATPAEYKSLTGLKLVLKVARSAKGFKPSATTAEVSGQPEIVPGVGPTTTVTTCDDFIVAIMACVESHPNQFPAAHVATFRDDVTMMAAAWRVQANGGDVAGAVAQCEAQAQAWRFQLAAMGCKI